MSKAYVSGWKPREKPEEHLIDYWFDTHPENAALWETKEKAENDCVIFNYHHITIPSTKGGRHVCSGFKVEQRAPKEFVVFCEAPFIIGKTGSGARS